MPNAQAFQDYVRKNWNDTPDGGLRDLYIMSTGLGGETGEVLELLKKHVRNDRVINTELLLELGDVLHYLTRIAQHFGMSLEQIMEANMMKLDARFDRKPRA